MTAARPHPLLLATLVASGLALALPYVAPGAVWAALVVALGSGALVLTRRTGGGRLLMWTIGMSFAVRATLGIALFFVSAYDVPLLRTMHLDHGLWSFGADGVAYHEQAVTIVDAWKGIDRSAMLEDLFPVSVPMAVVYLLLGASPLHVVLFNAWLGAVSGVLAYRLAVRLGDRPGALVAAALVAFWPSSIVWSTQLLKDTTMCAVIVGCLLLLVGIWQRTVASGPREALGLSAVARWMALVFAVFTLTFLRENVGFMLAATTAPVLLAASGLAARRRRWPEALAGVLLVGLVGGAVLTGMSFDMTRLLATQRPEVGYVNRGNALREQGDPEGAIVAYRHAISINVGYAPAYLELGWTLHDHKIDANAARTAFEGFLARDTSDHAEREAVFRALPALAPEEWLQARGTVDQPPPAASGGAAAPQRTSGTLPSRPVRRVPRAATLAKPPPMATAFEDEIKVGAGWLSFATIVALRKAQVEGVAGRPVDSVVFDTPLEFIVYLPRALANAYLAPYPWQLFSTAGHTGFMRPVGLLEVLLIAVLLPAIAMGHLRRLRRFRPDEWVVVAFTAGLALAYGVLMLNGGSLFRGRLQFLFPALALGAAALPAFVRRWFGAPAPDSPEAAV